MSKNTYFIDPQDERELARLQLQDNLFNEVIDIVPGQFVPGRHTSILDLACGPGGWALKVAQTYPECSVAGVDISPQMITYARAQAEARELSVQFRLMNILKRPWDFPDEHFDLVNIRFIGGLTPVASLEALFQECWRVLRPGGIIRNTEAVHMSTPLSPTAHRLTKITYTAMHRAGLCFSPDEMSSGAIIARILKQIGFKDIALVPYAIDLSYGAPMHRPMLENLRTSNQLLKPFIVQMKLCSLEELEKLLEEYNREWEQESFCAHWYLGSVTGNKDARPESDGTN